ncbi:hypothetical protein NFI96_021860, partial [Prochilodus magdalenae]
MDDNESAYRRTVDQVVLWSNQNNVELNTPKTVAPCFRRSPPALLVTTILDRTVMALESQVHSPRTRVSHITQSSVLTVSDWSSVLCTDCLRLELRPLYWLSQTGALSSVLTVSDWCSILCTGCLRLALRPLYWLSQTGAPSSVLAVSDWCSVLCTDCLRLALRPLYWLSQTGA